MLLNQGLKWIRQAKSLKHCQVEPENEDTLTECITVFHFSTLVVQTVSSTRLSFI